MKAKTKYRIHGVLYLIMCMFSMYLINETFAYFVANIDICSFIFLVLISFAWWESIDGMCKNIAYLRIIKLLEEAKRNESN